MKSGNGNKLKRVAAGIAALFFSLVSISSYSQTPKYDFNSPTVSSVTQIWSNAHHNAFTDLIRYQDKWYCTFREGAAHRSKDGKIRVLVSPDGEQWSSATLIEDTGRDLRDPHLCITPRGRLMLSYAAIGKDSMHPVPMQGRVNFTTSGTQWTASRTMDINDKFIWRVTWHQGIAYMVAYHESKGTYLYKSKDAIHYTPVTKIDLPGFMNEASILFQPNGDMQMLIRNEDPPKKAYVGTSKAPYTQWDFKLNRLFVGGPNMLRMPDQSVWAGFRQYENGEGKMVLMKSQNSELNEVLRLPAGGDAGYPGMYLYNDTLWVSYYSSHEGKTNIYLARIQFAKPKSEEIIPSM